MSKEFNIFNESDFDNMVQTFKNYFVRRKSDGHPFQKLKIISKKWQKSRSPAQLRAYWSCINQLTKALIDCGYEVNQDMTHNFVKVKSGFTEVIDGVMVPKSISDKSKDATVKNANELIEFIIRYAAQNLDTQIVIDHEDSH